MSDAPAKETKLRLFYAFELSDTVRAFATEAQTKLISGIGSRDARWTRPVDMHITALFLGEHSNDRLPQFERAGREIAATTPAFEVLIGGVGRFPTSGPPRVLWVGGDEPKGSPASTLISGLRRALVDIPFDKKPFKPHITLGYVKHNANRRSIEAALTSLHQTDERTLNVKQLVLMQTIPEADRRKSGSARYNIVQVFPFTA